MAWTAPHNYADGEIVTDTLLNVDIKANMEFLGSAHNHAGGAGQGSAVLGSLTSLHFADGGDPASVGILSANGTVLKYHNGGSVVALSHPQAAGTASLRALTFDGTGAANGTHVHAVERNTGGSLSINMSGDVTFGNSTNSASTTTATGSSMAVLHIMSLTSATSGAPNITGTYSINGTGGASWSCIETSQLLTFGSGLLLGSGDVTGSLRVHAQGASGAGTISFTTVLQIYAIGAAAGGP